jgi:hypothetical protein
MLIRPGISHSAFVRPLCFFLLTSFCLNKKAACQQRQTAKADRFVTDTLHSLFKRFNNLHITGYILPEWQLAQTKGIASYEGGNFPEFVDNRFMLREARVRFEYDQPIINSIFKEASFVYQVDATERGVGTRDMFARLSAFDKHKSYFTVGFVTRPFGNEVTYSTQLRETPERGRMSQILMPGERDLGAMLTYEPVVENKKKINIRYDIGVFNGQGTAGPADFDSYKDLVSRLTIKPVDLGHQLYLSGGVSGFYGGWVMASKYTYREIAGNSNNYFKVDSSEFNIGSRAPRQYYGADIQFGKKHNWGRTELRAEYWKGVQPGTATTTVSPGTLPLTPTYIRHFDGAFFYFIQSLFNPKWEAVVKYDWYDPNTKIAGKDITGPGFSAADIKYSTLGFGINHYFTDYLRVIFYYDTVKNEYTALQGYIGDLPDNVFTVRMQLRF